jgi:TonB family protein
MNVAQNWRVFLYFVQSVQRLQLSSALFSMKKILLLFLNSLFLTVTFFAQPPVKEEVIAPPPLQQSSVIEEQEEIFKVEYEVLSFPGCEDIYDRAQKKACSDRKLSEFIYSNITFPKLALENGVKGRVVIKFFVEKDGHITDAEIIEDIGFGCGAEALRVVNLMPSWNPGRPRGRAVLCQYRLPIDFVLDHGNKLKPTEIKVETEFVPYNDSQEKDIYDYVSYPPIWVGCEGIFNYSEKEKCSEERFAQFIKANLKYPKKARRKKIEGTVYVSFIIERDGTISNAYLKSEIGEGCGAEALRVINSMPKWNPANHLGKKVRYRTEVPIGFYLK